MKRRMLLGVTVTLCLAGSAGAGQWIGPGTGAEALAAHDLDRLLAQDPLAAGANIKAVTLFRNERSAQLLVQVRDREPVHYHADSDITVFMLRGRGIIHVGPQARPVKAGDVLHIPLGVVHYYVNHGPEVGVALVVYSPPPGPNDRVLVETPAAR